MCNAWQKPLGRELSLDEYERMFCESAGFLSKIKHVSFTGGEPTLRDDLCDIVKLVTQYFPSDFSALVMMIFILSGMLIGWLI